MAVDQRRRQKKLAKKRARGKAQKKALANRRSRGVAQRLADVADAPILHSAMFSGLWKMGIGSVLVSRELHLERVAFGIFLVDVYCLGVKNAYADIVPRRDYNERIMGRYFHLDETTHVEPSFARKLVEDAVDYARGLGFGPHADYKKARAVFGDIDPAECDVEFEFGKDGKPYFISGPDESPEKCRRILATLDSTLGEDNFGCLLSPGSFARDNLGTIGIFSDDEDDADEFDEDDEW